MFLKKGGFDINLEDFEPIPEAMNDFPSLAISVLPSGDVRLNDRFQRELAKHVDSFKLGFEINKKNKRILRIFITDTPNYTFPKNGKKKDRVFTKTLVESGVVLPAKYIVEWHEEFASWIAILNEELKPNALTDTLKKATKKAPKND